MKAIINGRRFDTAKAIKVGSASGGFSIHDSRHFYETLYRTPISGAYFLHGEGGSLTYWSDSERIRPLLREEALKWAEANLDAASIEEHFADSIEDA